MLALIAQPETMSGPIPVALRYGGLEPRPTSTTEEAEKELGTSSAGACVLLLDAGSLDVGAGPGTWRAFLSRHPALPVVIVAHEDSDLAANAVGREPHHVLLVDPFDAAAIVAAVRRAITRPLSSAPVRCVTPGWRETG
jgi:DNA-binding NtrC family response regulator